jgi:hypothetical protein
MCVRDETRGTVVRYCPRTSGMKHSRGSGDPHSTFPAATPGASESGAGEPALTHRSVWSHPWLTPGSVE